MPTWEMRLKRQTTQSNGRRRRTVGSYQIFHDGVAVDGLFGTTAESPGPSENDHGATVADPRRILAQRYQLGTHIGPHYATIGYRDDPNHPVPLMPGLEVLGFVGRSDILIHPGKNEFLSSIGCINLCTTLPEAAELIDFVGSRRRVIAVIDDMRSFLGNAFPARNNRAIHDAWLIIEE